MPKKRTKLAWKPGERERAYRLNEELKAATKKPKPPKVDPKDQAVESLKKLSKIVERCLVALGEIKLPEQQEAPNTPEKHESVQAVKGQAPRI